MTWKDSDTLDESWLPAWDPDVPSHDARGGFEVTDADDVHPDALCAEQPMFQHELSEAWWLTLFARLELLCDAEDDALDAEIQAWLEQEPDWEDDWEGDNEAFS